MKSFKKGDIIVCIKNLENFPESLTEGKRYEVLSVLNRNLVYIRNDKNIIHCYSPQRFITIQEDRNLKIKKLQENV